MITAERLARYKQQALDSVKSRANNPAAPGVACINVSPHDLLDLILSYEETAPQREADPEGEAP